MPIRKDKKQQEAPRSLNHNTSSSNNATVQQMPTERGWGGMPPVQRMAKIGGAVKEKATPLSDIDTEGVLKDGEKELAQWMLQLDDHEWTFTNADAFISEVQQAHAMSSLINSILTSGILSRTKLNEKGMDYVGSEDTKKTGALAVNVLDSRGDKDSNGQVKKTPTKIAEESMTMQDRGSISVALERENDPLKQGFKKKEDVELSEQDKTEFATATSISVEDISKYGDMIVGPLKQKKADEYNQGLVSGDYKDEMERRARNTVMAVVNEPDEDDYAMLSKRTDSYESDVKSQEIKPGAEGFQTLLIPAWFRPFAPKIAENKPDSVTIVYVGNKDITAQYKAMGDHYNASISAPDYASEVGPLLTKFGTLATHILTSDHRRTPEA